MPGRAGDIINVLPCAWHFHQRGDEVSICVGKEYAEILDGVTYAQPVIWNGDIMDGSRAANMMATGVSGRFNHVINARVPGRKPDDAKTESFTKEMYHRCGLLDQWDRLPTVFDNRNVARESPMVDRLPKDKPVILLAASGISSPFDAGSEVLQSLIINFPEHATIPLGWVRRFYDLLGLFDRAACLVTIDSGPLHLANASMLPVVALISDHHSSWHGSAARSNHYARINYSDFSAGALIEAVNGVPCVNYKGRVIHVWSEYKRDQEAQRRHEFACSTWKLFKTPDPSRRIGIAVTDESLERMSPAVGDSGRVPFVRDLINWAPAKPNDIILLTNDDTCMVDGLENRIINECMRHGACFAYRWDSHKKLTEPIPHSAIWTLNSYCGSDLFAFTGAWWERYGAQFPDMLLGREAWDKIMRTLIVQTGGVEIKGAIYHEKHQSFWEHSPGHMNNEGNKYNRRLARAWLTDHGYPLEELADKPC